MSNDTETDDPSTGAGTDAEQSDDHLTTEGDVDDAGTASGSDGAESEASTTASTDEGDTESGNSQETPAHDDTVQDGAQETAQDSEPQGDADDDRLGVDVIEDRSDDDPMAFDDENAGDKPPDSAFGTPDSGAIDSGSETGLNVEEPADEQDDEQELGEDLGSTLDQELIRDDYDPEEEEDLLGGLDIETTDKISVPDRLVDQVIGQDEARDIIIKAAKQRRHVMMIGPPGTGKSMLAKAMSQLLPKEELQDVLVYHNPDDGNAPKVRTVPAGKGDQIIDAHKEEAQKRNQMRLFLMLIIVAVIIGYTIFTPTNILLGLIAAIAVYFLFRYTSRNSDSMVPNMIVDNSWRDSQGEQGRAVRRRDQHP